MLGIIQGYGFALFTAMVVIVGDYLIKVAADGNMPLTSRFVVAGSLLYGASALLWYFAMRHATLAQAGVAFSMFSLIALCFIGAFYFDEPIRLREGLGICCALLSMVLMVRFA